MKNITLQIEGMHCENCANRLEKALLNNEKIKTVKVDFATKKATITYDELTIANLKELISNIGFEAK